MCKDGIDPTHLALSKKLGSEWALLFKALRRVLGENFTWCRNLVHYDEMANVENFGCGTRRNSSRMLPDFNLDLV